jgi:hypothetical protein
VRPESGCMIRVEAYDWSRDVQSESRRATEALMCDRSWDVQSES